MRLKCINGFTRRWLNYPRFQEIRLRQRVQGDILSLGCVYRKGIEWLTFIYDISSFASLHNYIQVASDSVFYFFDSFHASNEAKTTSDGVILEC